MCDHCGCRTLTPVARLMAEHDRLRELSGQIRQSLAGADEVTARRLFDDLLVVLGPHVQEEEGALFPVLRGQAELTEHVDLLAGEHAELYDAVDDLPEPPTPSAQGHSGQGHSGQGHSGQAHSGAWRDGVLAILHELDEHMFKEDFGLFPAAIALLDGDDWDAMERAEQATGGPVGEPAGTAPA
ncbi:hypothetical protein A7K94_0220945 [Modestobacter sp. VKM Ac-2676]|nr:hypothetical protein A7K94_0220945 [Modestobacter sp. VKM Ac-2676]